MATIYGTVGSKAGIYPGRRPWVIVTHTRNGTKATVRYRVGSDPLYDTAGTFSGNLKVNGSNYAISGPVPRGASATMKDFTVTYNQASAFNLAITLTGSVPGTSGWISTSLSGNYSVPAGVLPPSPPTDVSFTRTSDSAISLSWTKGSGATSTKIRQQINGGSWADRTTSTGTSVSLTGLAVNSSYRFNVSSVNAAGTSAVAYANVLYTAPTKPTKPTISGQVVKWTLPGRFADAIRVQRTQNGGTNVTTKTLGNVTSWTDPTATNPLTQYRVEVSAGTGASKGTSAWSDWSDNAMAATYKPPAVTKISAQRCDSSGNLTELGQYVRVVTSGTVSSVKDGTTETNKVTRKLSYRRKGTTTWTNEATLVLNGTPKGWSNVAVVTGSNNLLETQAWEIRYTVQDVYTGLVQSIVDLPVSKVSLSLGPDGIGAGKTWQRGALDVGGHAYFEGRIDTDIGITMPVVNPYINNVWPLLWNPGRDLVNAVWPSGIMWSANTSWVPPADGVFGSIYTQTAPHTVTTPGGMVPVTTGAVLYAEIWVRANVAGSRIYVEIRDQGGTIIPSTAYDGDEGSGNYLLGNVLVTTTWAQYKIKITVPTGVTYIQQPRIYLNHTNSTNTGTMAIAARCGFSPWPDPNTIVIDGVPYLKTGTTKLPTTPSFTKFGDCYVRTVSVTLPTLPSGWVYMTTGLQSSGYSFAEAYSTSRSGVLLRHLQIGNDQTSATSAVRWQVVRAISVN